MDIFTEIVKRRASPGVLVFDIEGHLLYSNHDALEMIAALGENDPAEVGSEFVLPAEIFTLCQETACQLKGPETNNGGQLPRAVLVSESGLALSLRALTMGDHGKERASTHVMVLIERIIKKHEVDFEKAEKEFFLSRRETDVLKLICHGNTNREIAKNLFICEDTVKGHIKKIMQKMTVNSRSEIIVALK
jgi:ATP/maltotriose-dependent transcriptional regulator MalT